MADTKTSELPEITTLEPGDLIEVSKDAGGSVYDSRKITVANMAASFTAGNDNNQTGTTYDLVATDGTNTTVWMNNAAANDVSIPLNATVPLAVGTKIAVIMEGAGVTSITAVTGVTLNGTDNGSVVINNQYQGATLTKRATDAWHVNGDIS